MGSMEQDCVELVEQYSAETGEITGYAYASIRGGRGIRPVQDGNIQETFREIASYFLRSDIYDDKTVQYEVIPKEGSHPEHLCSVGNCPHKLFKSLHMKFTRKPSTETLTGLKEALTDPDLISELREGMTKYTKIVVVSLDQLLG